MIIKHFSDTDTLYVQFSNRDSIETRDLDRNTVIDLDANGELVAMTIEHATETASMHEFSFQSKSQSAY
ncbi:MAG TPA: DUF2283 domain-containing protein [Spirochaetota bacterium]|nr:DUF2283 domain-containing protein [Spirochaetota bacterium]